MTDPIVVTLTLIMIGQIALTVPLLLTRGVKSAIYFPLALFLFANGILALEPVMSSLFPHWYALYTACAFPMLFILCPSLWFYIEALTSKKTWQLSAKQLPYYFLLWPALLVSVMILLLPPQVHTAIFINDAEVTDPYEITLVVSILVLVLLWLGQCIYTMYRITLRLLSYKKQLNDLFSNHEHKTLNWMNGLLILAISTWVFSLVSVFASNLFDNLFFSLRVEALLSLLLVWSLAHYGLLQKPVLSELNVTLETEADNEPKFRKEIAGEITVTVHNNAYIKQSDNINSNSDICEKEKSIKTEKKYQRSALGIEQSERIAKKINSVMEQDKLYLDANLSLHKLASYVAISPNYISQTLNETLSINFFDFVNQWRVKAAKPRIITNEDTILTIALAVGFNARSSFYKAFKQETGQTPTEFRKKNT